MNRSKKIKDDVILNELYRRSFAASNPYGDWDEILENSPLDKDGKKLIPYMDYECPRIKLEEIFDSVMNEYKVPNHKIGSFSFHFWLGCSPKSSK